jgi:parallel beta-helix repeat protein
VKDNLGAKMSIPNLKVIKKPGQVIPVLIGLLFLLAFAPALYAATYYVDATMGKDTNDGLAEVTAWKTIAKVNVSRFIPGDQILFKRGEVWREMLKVASSGTEQKSISYGAYGAGELPVITGLDSVQVWELETGYVYRAEGPSRLPRVLVLDGELGNRRATKTDLSSNGDWYFDKARTLLFLYSETDPRLRTIEIGQRDCCIQDNNAGYITVESLKLSGANCAWGGAIDIRGKAGPWTVRSCFVTNSNSNGITLVNSGSLLFGNVISRVGNYGIHIHESSHNTLVAKNEISYCHAGIEIVGKSNIFESNLIHHNDWNGIYLEGRPSQGTSADYNIIVSVRPTHLL